MFFVEVNVLSAPTSLGNRPYESDGTARWTDQGPARLRDQNLVERLGARDLGDVPAAEYRDFIRPPGGIRNEDLVLDHVRRIELSSQADENQFAARSYALLQWTIIARTA